MQCRIMPFTKILHSSFFILHLKSTWFQLEPGSFFQIEHQVHVVYRLAAGAFQQVVNARHDEKFVHLLVLTTCFRSMLFSTICTNESSA